MIDEYASPEELRRLLSTLLVTIGAIMIFALFAFIVVPGLRNANKPPAETPVAAPQGESGWLDPTEYPPAKGYELPPVDPQTLMTANPAMLEHGKALFEEHCVACHGPTGHGDGPAAEGISPPPRDFTRSEDWKNGYRLTEIYKSLSEGITDSAMTAYDHLSAADRMALDHYVQSLGAFPHGTDDPAALAALAQQFATGAERVPNRIPVSRAIEKIAQEDRAVAPLPAAAGDESPTGRAVALAVTDRARAARTLAQTPAWRESPAALAKAVVPGAPGNGFSVAAATLGAADWQLVYDRLVAMPAP